MAKIFPRYNIDDHSDIPNSEKKAYKALAELPDQYTVLFNTHWTGKQALRGSQDFECDFIVCHPEHGLLVIEVKGGGIRYDGAAGEWFSENNRGIFRIKDPIEQALKNKHALKKYLFDRFQDQFGQKPQIRLAHCVWFVDTDTTRGVFPRADRAIVMDRDALYNPQEAVEKSYEYFASEHARRSQNKATLNKAVSILLPKGEFTHSIVRDIAYSELEVLELTKNQLKILRNLERQKRVFISGGAGTGKTVLGMEKARRLAESGQKVLYTCYSRPVANRLAARNPIDGVTIVNFHRLCHEYAAHIGRASEFEQKENYTSEEFWKYTSVEILLDAIAATGDELKFDSIIVDEVQDFSDTWLDTLINELIRDKAAGSVYLLGDSSQKIFDREAGHEVLEGFMPFELYENLRNTKAIFSCFDPIIQTGCDPCGPNGNPVEFIRVDGGSVAKIVEKKVNILKSEKIAPSAITVLSGSGPTKYLPDLCNTPGFTTDVLEDQKVLLSTIHSYKGLENDVVIVCGLEKLSKDKRDELVYVACSRAKHLLIVVGDEQELAIFGEVCKKKAG